MDGRLARVEIPNHRLDGRFAIVIERVSADFYRIIIGTEIFTLSRSAVKVL